MTPLKYVPEWMPGADFKKEANEIRIKLVNRYPRIKSVPKIWRYFTGISEGKFGHGYSIINYRLQYADLAEVMFCQNKIMITNNYTRNQTLICIGSSNHWAYIVLGFKEVGRCWYIYQPKMEVASTNHRSTPGAGTLCGVVLQFWDMSQCKNKGMDHMKPYLEQP